MNYRKWIVILVTGVSLSEPYPVCGNNNEMT